MPKSLQLVVRQAKLHRLFDAVCADDARRGNEQAGHAVLPFQQRGDGEYRLFVVINGLHDLRKRRGYPEFRRAFSVGDAPRLFAYFIKDRIFVERRAALRQGLSAQRDVRPDGDLRISVLAQV
jgi:hypothetical protein